MQVGLPTFVPWQRSRWSSNGVVGSQLYVHNYANTSNEHIASSLYHLHVLGNLPFRLCRLWMSSTHDFFFNVAVLRWTIMNSLKIASATSCNSSTCSRCFYYFREHRGSAHKRWGRIIDVVQRFHVWNKVDVGEHRASLASPVPAPESVFVFVRADW